MSHRAANMWVLCVRWGFQLDLALKMWRPGRAADSFRKQARVHGMAGHVGAWRWTHPTSRSSESLSYGGGIRTALLHFSSTAPPFIKPRLPLSCFGLLWRKFPGNFAAGVNVWFISVSLPLHCAVWLNLPEWNMNAKIQQTSYGLGKLVGS